MKKKNLITLLVTVIASAGCGGGGGGSSESAQAPASQTPIAVKTTSYENFKNIGLTPVSLPSSISGTGTLARGYADFSRRGEMDVFAAAITYSPALPQSQATPSRFEFWQKQGSTYAKNTTLLTDNAGCIHPRKAAVADYNNDGRPDVFVACHGYDAAPFPGEKNKVVLSQPDGTYRTQDASTDVGFFHGAAAADLNGDGFVDVVVVNNADPKSVFVLLNQGNGTFKRETTDRFPSSLGGRSFFSVDLTDVNEDGKLDLLLGGHEWEGGPAFVLINPGNNDFTNVTPTALPSVASEGVILDFTITGTSSTRTIWVLRTSGGDGTFYQSRTVQKVLWPSLTSTVVLNQRPAQWVPWTIPATIGNQKVITSDDANFGLSVSQ